MLQAMIYLLCLGTSLLCAYLLLRAYLRTRMPLLVRSSLCFALLAVNNLLVVVDILLLPDTDLTTLRLVASLAAVSVLLYGFIWEA